MTDWTPIANPGLRHAVEKYRREKGRDPRVDEPSLDGDESLLGIYLIMMGYSPVEEGAVLPYRRRPAAEPDEK